MVKTEEMADAAKRRRIVPTAPPFPSSAIAASITRHPAVTSVRRFSEYVGNTSIVSIVKFAILIVGSASEGTTKSRSRSGRRYMGLVAKNLHTGSRVSTERVSIS